MCFKCCLTLYRHALCIPHEWQHKAAPLRSWRHYKATILCAFFFFFVCFLPPAPAPALFLSVSHSAPLFTQCRHVQHLCTAPSSRRAGRHLSAKTLTNRDRDERSHDSPSPHRAHTLSEDTDVSAAHWHSQCHLMFCLAVRTALRDWAQKCERGQVEPIKTSDKSSSTRHKTCRA